MKNKNSAAILAFFLGGIGVHKFYLGETGWGIFYAIFFWTHIPILAGFVEALLLLSMPQADFDAKYNHRNILGCESRQLTNHLSHQALQVVVNIDGKHGISTTYQPVYGNKIVTLNNPSINDEIAAEQIDRRILKLCMNKGEVTLLDCFMAIDNVPKSILESRLASLVGSEFLQIGNRYGDGKVVYRLDN